jgi:hypothetical protein
VASLTNQTRQHKHLHLSMKIKQFRQHRSD